MTCIYFYYNAIEIFIILPCVNDFYLERFTVRVLQNASLLSQNAFCMSERLCFVVFGFYLSPFQRYDPFRHRLPNAHSNQSSCLTNTYLYLQLCSLSISRSPIGNGTDSTLIWLKFQCTAAYNGSIEKSQSILKHRTTSDNQAGKMNDLVLFHHDLTCRSRCGD
jgi:hypothetical protein